ncbi:MAG: outer membrane beta-barrel protein [Bacteroidia bacterium]
MKNFLFTFAFLLVGLSLAMGQTKPLAGDWGLGFRITGLQNVSLENFRSDQFDIPQGLGRYYLSDRLAVRLSFGVQSNSSTSDYTFGYTDEVRFPTAYRVDTVTRTTVSQFGLNFSPGMEWHMAMESPKLDPYVGAEIPISYLGAETVSFDNEFQYLDADGAVVYKSDINTRTETAGGLSVGLNLIAGFNYFITDKIAVGAEYNLGAAYSQLGGDIKVSQTGIIQPTPNVDQQVPINDNFTVKNVTTTIGVGLASSGGIHFSIFW